MWGVPQRVIALLGLRRASAPLVALILFSSCGQASVGPAGAPTEAPLAAASPSPVVTADAATPTPGPTVTPTPRPTPAPIATPEPRYDQVPVPANDAVALAQQLAMAESAIRDPNVTGAKLVWMGHLQQLSYGRLADYPEWREHVLAALPEQTRKAVTFSTEAGRQLRMMTGPIPKTLPDWRIVEPAPVDDLLSYYRKAEAEFGVAWYYLAAIHLVETRMGRIRGLSSAGAQGPMQFIPSTWAAYGKGDVNSDHDSILAAGRYLKAAGAPGDMPKALFAYNHSDRYVRAISAYAEAMKGDPAAFRGYYGWQVYYPTVDGPVLLAVGWKKE